MYDAKSFTTKIDQLFEIMHEFSVIEICQIQSFCKIL